MSQYAIESVTRRIRFHNPHVENLSKRQMVLSYEVLLAPNLPEEEVEQVDSAARKLLGILRDAPRISQ